MTTKPHTEMNEGPQAFEAFRQAVKKILSVPKSELPKIQTKKPVATKA
jgi:DNA-directed RNA polymerase subunit H (RpoH/RPB5)